LNIYNSISEIKIPNPIATIGIFDGVHIAHKKIFEKLIETAKNSGGSSLVVTLWPHPRNVIQSGNAPIKLITSLQEKIELIEKTGIDNLIILPFNRNMADTGFEEFVVDILVKGIGISHLVVGFNHHFGKNREGNFDKLLQLSEKFNFGLEQLEPVILNSEKVSSSVIRRLILSGDVFNANIFLGYRFSITGVVVEGNKIGRKLGFPTANIQIDDTDKILPANGVYGVFVQIDNGTQIKGMMNIGYRPTFTENNLEKILEVHLMDFHEDIYGRKLKILFVKKVRDEKKFKNTKELTIQLEKDRNLVMNILS
jgi:riboflavin kinase/FMN adenylyltransferase